MALRRRTVLAALPGTLAAMAAGRAAARAAEAGDAPALLASYERDSGGRVGVWARNIATGSEFAWRADERFVMCSTFKLSLAALVLSRVDRGAERLDTPIRFGPSAVGEDWAPVAKANLARGALSVGEMCEAAVAHSDNVCANLLLERVGGPPAMTVFWRSIGDPVSRLDHGEPLLNRSPPGDPHDTTSPAAMAANVRRFVFGPTLAAASRARLLAWMVAADTGADRLRRGLPKTWRVGDKTGNNGADAAGDLAVAWTPAGAPLVMAAYVQGGAPTPGQLTDLFAGVGRMVAERLG